MTQLTPEQREEILKIAGKYGVTNIRVFGSYARGDADENSDLDLLIDMERPGLSKLVGFKLDAEEVIHKPVDVVKETGLHWYIKDRVINEARPL